MQSYPEKSEEEIETPAPVKRGSILDERLPHRFGNRQKRRKMQAEIRKLVRKTS